MEPTSCEIAFQFMCSVKNALKTQNRFSCDERMDQLIHLLIKENAMTIEHGTRLFRARIYKENDAEERFRSSSKSKFRGYNAKQSFVNLNNDLIPDGRCNPTYIPYLYTSATEACCIYEVRPAKGDYVSVARISVKEDLKIVNLSRDVYWATECDPIVDGALNSTLSFYLAAEFQRLTKEPGGYLLCQYVSEKIKQSEFDGLAYCSSVYKPQGKRRRAKLGPATNIVVFNYEKCQATSSHLRKIDEVKLVF